MKCRFKFVQIIIPGGWIHETTMGVIFFLQRNIHVNIEKNVIGEKDVTRKVQCIF